MGAMAAATIGAIVLYAIYSGISNTFKFQKQVNSVGEVQVIKNQLQGLLNDPSVCQSVMRDASGKIAKFDPSLSGTMANQGNNLANIDYNGYVIAGVKSFHNSLNVQGVALSEADPSKRQDVIFNSIPAKNYRALLTVTVQRPPSYTDSLKFPLSVTTNNNPSSPDYRRILECSSVFERGIASGTNTAARTDYFLGSYVHQFGGSGTSAVTSFAVTVPVGTELVKVVMVGQNQYSYGAGSAQTEDKIDANFNINLAALKTTGYYSAIGGSAGYNVLFSWLEQPLMTPSNPSVSVSLIGPTRTTAAWGTNNIAQFRPEFFYDASTRKLELRKLNPTTWWSYSWLFEYSGTK